MRRLLALALLERGREGGGRSGRRFPRVAEVGVAGRTAERVNALQPRKGLGAHASSSLFSGGASRFALNFSLPPLATRLFTFSGSSTYSVPVLSLAASFLFRCFVRRVLPVGAAEGDLRAGAPAVPAGAVPWEPSRKPPAGASGPGTTAAPAFVNAACKARVIRIPSCIPLVKISADKADWQCEFPGLSSKRAFCE